MVCVGAYYIRPTNTHDHAQIIDPPDTCWGVCNTSLPIRDKYLINTYLLNLIPDKDWMVRVGAYCIRHTNSNDHWQMIDPPGTFRSVCNTPLPILDKSLINMYLLNLILVKDWIVRVRAYCIRPTNTNVDEQMIDLPGTWCGVYNTPLTVRTKKWFSFIGWISNPVRAEAYAIYPYRYGLKIWFLFIGWISNPVHAGAYAIRPYRYGINT